MHHGRVDSNRRTHLTFLARLRFEPFAADARAIHCRDAVASLILGPIERTSVRLMNAVTSMPSFGTTVPTPKLAVTR